MTSKSALSFVVAILLSTPIFAAAQDEDFAAPSETQLQLFQEGAEAFSSDEFDRAIKLFKASLLVGELNITYLNLGRAHFKLGQCQEAREAFAKVRKAPRVRTPSPESVMGRLNEYVVELDKDCGVVSPIDPVDPVDANVVPPKDDPLKAVGGMRIQIQKGSGSFDVDLALSGQTFRCPGVVTRDQPCILSNLPTGEGVIQVTGDMELAQAFVFPIKGALVEIQPRSHKALTTGKWMMGVGGGLSLLAIILLATTEGESLGASAALGSLGTMGLSLGGVTALIGYVIQDEGGIFVTPNR